MARTIDLVRHTDSDGDTLTNEGIAAAMALAERVPGGYTTCVSTGAQRATQTIACALAAGGWTVPCGVIVETGLRSTDEDRWRAAYRTAGSSELAALGAADPDFVAAESSTLGAALRRVLDSLSDDAAALVVGHSPTSEAAILGLTGVAVDPLSKGEGVRVVEDAGAFTVEPLP